MMRRWIGERCVGMMRCFFLQAEDGMRDLVRTRGVGDVYKRQGLDTTMAVADSLYAEFKEPLFASPPLLSRMVEAGLLGRKTGRGFYEYQR